MVSKLLNIIYIFFFHFLQFNVVQQTPHFFLRHQFSSNLLQLTSLSTRLEGQHAAHEESHERDDRQEVPDPVH